jgi:hypothetical protein
MVTEIFTPICVHDFDRMEQNRTPRFDNAIIGKLHSYVPRQSQWNFRC